jgi:hypothetical protein
LVIETLMREITIERGSLQIQLVQVHLPLY